MLKTYRKKGIVVVREDNISHISLSIMINFVKQRYYYYIHHGIDTEHVAPMESSWLDHVMQMVPNSLKVSSQVSIMSSK